VGVHARELNLLIRECELVPEFLKGYCGADINVDVICEGMLLSLARTSDTEQVVSPEARGRPFQACSLRRLRSIHKHLVLKVESLRPNTCYPRRPLYDASALVTPAYPDIGFPGGPTLQKSLCGVGVSCH
jgi:hypothetical protein